MSNASPQSSSSLWSIVVPIISGGGRYLCVFRSTLAKTVHKQARARLDQHHLFAQQLDPWPHSCMGVVYQRILWPIEDDDAADIEEESGKVVAQVGFAESLNPIGQDLERVRELKVEQEKERFKPQRAAVLVCIFEGVDGDLRVILTKRSSRLSTHSGEVALPGGKAEEGDKDDTDTATREAQEEIGLDPSLVNVVTTLEPFLSKHLMKVVPVIGILSNKDAFKADPNAAEVESVFDAPLEMFIKDDHRRAEEREWMGYKYLIHYFDHETDNKKYVIWGLTAAILIRAASVVYQRPPPFLEQNPKFKVPSSADKDTVMR